MNSIPASLAPFFQEYRLEDLDLERSAHTIIERTLRFGNREGDPLAFRQLSQGAHRPLGRTVWATLPARAAPDVLAPSVGSFACYL